MYTRLLYTIKSEVEQMETFWNFWHRELKLNVRIFCYWKINFYIFYNCEMSFLYLSQWDNGGIGDAF